MLYCWISLAVIHTLLKRLEITQSDQSTSHQMNQDLIIDCFEETRKQCRYPESCAKPYKLTVQFLESNTIISQKNNYKDISQTMAKPYTFLDEESGKFYFISYPESAISGRNTGLDGTYRCQLTLIGRGKTFTTHSINYKSLTFIGSPRMFAS